MTKIIVLFIKWIFSNVFGNKKFHAYMSDFSYIWVFLVAILCIAFFAVPCNWDLSIKLFSTILVLLTILILFLPMNTVYGLMGTSGSIRLFFFNFILISSIFSSIYYFGFFKTAGITYDANQPHIDYMMYDKTINADSIKANSMKNIEPIKKDTVYLEHKLDSVTYTETIISTHITRDTLTTLHYQPIDFWQVWRSTILTTLTQESADLLSIATVHNEAMKSTNPEMDKEKSELFEWILIFHIIISWIFFGVFISLLYNKFRYES